MYLAQTVFLLLIWESPCIMFMQYARGGQYTRRSSVHWGIPLSTLGDIMSTLGVFSTVEEPWVHRRIPWRVWGISWVQQRVFSRSGDTMSILGDTMMSVGDIMSTPGMFTTLGFSYKYNYFPNDPPPHSSWYPPGVLMISAGVLNTPSVLMISPIVLQPSPSVLHRHYAGWE